jgi:guanylate kinase
MTGQSIEPGLLLVVSAPSGAGKTSLVNALVSNDDNIRVSVSHTTRARRGNERDGGEYFFVDAATFAAMRDAGAFLEHATVFGNSYGTSRAAVERELAAGRDVLLEIDWQGAQQIRRSFPTAVSLFILPPSHHALSERLRRRGEDNDEAIGKRTAEAVIEMSHHDEYDYLIVNDRFDDAIADLRAIIRAERLRSSRQVRRRGALLQDLLSHGKPIQ